MINDKNTHTCSEMSFRITDVDCIGRAKTPQLNLPGVVWWPNVYIYIYTYIYIVTSQLRTTAPRDCHCSAQLRPPLKGLPSRATACRYVYTGPGGVSSLATDPPGTPVAPCKQKKFYIYSDGTHTRPATAGQMRWRWKWHESENGMKVT